MKCPYCNAEVGEDDIYCEECGGALGQKVQKRKPPILILIVILILIIGLGAGGAYWFIQQKAEKAAEMSDKEKKTDKETVNNSKAEAMGETEVDGKTDIVSKVEETSDKITICREKESKNDKESEEDEDSYIIEESNQRYLTDADVKDLSLREINYAKNEIYARHGRKFQSPELQNYFNSKTWYEGKYEPSDFDQHYSGTVLNDYEKKNADFLREVEFGMDPAGYLLDQ